MGWEWVYIYIYIYIYTHIYIYTTLPVDGVRLMWFYISLQDFLYVYGLMIADLQSAWNHWLARNVMCDMLPYIHIYIYIYIHVCVWMTVLGFIKVAHHTDTAPMELLVLLEWGNFRKTLSSRNTVLNTRYEQTSVSPIKTNREWSSLRVKQ